MAWFPVDDEMSFHPKIMAAGNAAVGVWARAGAWCKKYTTGGFVPLGVAHSFGIEECSKLVAVGLWIEGTDPTLGEGYRFHEWTKRSGNGTAEEEKERKEKERERWRRQKQNQRSKPEKPDTANVHPRTDGVEPSSDSAYPQSQSQSHDLLLTELVSLGSNAREKSTDAEAIESAKNLAAGLGLDLDSVIKEASRIDRDLTHPEALRLATFIAAKSKCPPENMTAYVMGTFKKSPLEVQQWIDREVRA